jgi:hypothetical protein
LVLGCARPSVYGPTMARCIYVPERELNDDRPRNERTRSIEHVVPWALGGSNGCTTEDVSWKANSDLGTEIDAPFSNLLSIAFWRHTLQLKGQSRTIPPIVFDAIATKNGTPAEITFHADGRVEFTPKLSVQREPIVSGAEKVAISGQRLDVERVLSGMRKRAEQTGKKFHAFTGDPLASIADFEEHYETVELDEFKVLELLPRFPGFNQRVWARSIMKMVLALGHKVLGPEWTFGEWGNLVRRCLADDETQWPKDRFRGRLTCRLPRQICDVLGMTPASFDRYEHVIAILPADNDKQLMPVVSLFGGENVPQAVIGIGPPVGALRVPADDTLPRQIPVGWRIRPSARVAEPITAEEMVTRAGS